MGDDKNAVWRRAIIAVLILGPALIGIHQLLWAMSPGR